MRLQGNVAIITGAAHGIGRAYAERFAAEGASVIIVDIRSDDAATAAASIRSTGGQASSLMSDVASEEAMDHVAAEVIARFGRVDTLINNAALFGDMDFRDQSIAYLERAIRVNMLGALIASRTVFPQMKAQGSGSIINIASAAAYEYVTDDGLNRDRQTIPSFSYSLTKSGIISLTKFMAGAIGKYGIRVNCISPGMTLSETTKRVVSPENIAGTAVYLASNDSKLVTGQVIMVDAGYVMPA